MALMVQCPKCGKAVLQADVQIGPDHIDLCRGPAVSERNPDSGRARQLRGLLAAATPAPWRTPFETHDPYHPDCPIDHEGCEVWPWKSRADMDLAYWLRNHADAIVAALDR